MKTSILFQIIFAISFLTNAFTATAQKFNVQTTSPVGLAISGPRVVCEIAPGNFVKYEVRPSLGNFTYAWKMPQGMIIHSGQGQAKIIAEVDYSFINGWVTINKTDDNGITVTDSMYVDILPETPIFKNAAKQTAADQVQQYSVASANNTNYIWTAPYGAVIMEGQGTSSVKIKFSQSFIGGNVSVAAENNCGVSASNKIRVNLAQQSITDNGVLKSLTPGDIAFHDNLTTATFRDTIKRGDDYYFEVVLQNFSQTTMDSFYLKYYLASKPNDFVKLLVQKFDGGEARTLPVLIIPTDGLAGTHELIIQLNPDKTTLETDYSNNNITVPFTVKDDLASSNQEVFLRETNVYNYPNPMSEQTLFHIELGSNFSETSTARLAIYNLNGQMVKQFNTSANGNGTFANVLWDRSDLYGTQLPTGTYFYTVTATNNNGEVETISPKSNIQIVN
jgi:hypothetical protein